MDLIGGKLYSNHPKNLNHIHKDAKDLVYVIITVGKYIIGGDTVFYDGVFICTCNVKYYEYNFWTKHAFLLQSFQTFASIEMLWGSH